MKALWCKIVGHKWKRRYYPGLDMEEHECRRCAESHVEVKGVYTDRRCLSGGCYVEPAEIL